MARAKTIPRKKRSGGKKTYIFKKRSTNPKSVRFGNTQFTIRYERIETKSLRNK